MHAVSSSDPSVIEMLTNPRFQAWIREEIEKRSPSLPDEFLTESGRHVQVIEYALFYYKKNPTTLHQKVQDLVGKLMVWDPLLLFISYRRQRWDRSYCLRKDDVEETFLSIVWHEVVKITYKVFLKTLLPERLPEENRFEFLGEKFFQGGLEGHQ